MLFRVEFGDHYTPDAQASDWASVPCMSCGLVLRRMDRLPRVRSLRHNASSGEHVALVA